jgi:Streptomyces sporulation and cell division protein, SsgA
VADISVPLVAWPGDPDAEAVPIDLRLEYSRSDPYAVTLRFPESAEMAGVAWMFGRDLLITGLQGPAGIGAVHIAPDESVIAFRLLLEPGITLVYHLPAAEVMQFLGRTCALVAPGAESAYLDWLPLVAIQQAALQEGGDQ